MTGIHGWTQLEFVLLSSAVIALNLVWICH